MEALTYAAGMLFTSYHETGSSLFASIGEISSGKPLTTNALG
jgi:hypothetical protein